MSDEKPWHKHNFRPGIMTPNACQICGKGKLDDNHRGRKVAWVRRMTLVVKRKPWKVYGE